MTKRNRAARAAAKANPVTDAVDLNATTTTETTAIVPMSGTSTDAVEGEVLPPQAEPTPTPEPTPAAERDETMGDEEWDAARDKIKSNAKSGVMSRKYHRVYTAQGGNNGDSFAVAMREAFMTTDDKGDESINRAKLVAWAQANGFWIERYDTLNPGMIRMNVGNRARAAIRKGKAVQLDGATYTAADLIKG